MKNKNLKYAEAMARLEEILESIDKSETGIDELADQVSEASGLLVECRRILTETESRVAESLQVLEQSSEKSDRGEE